MTGKDQTARRDYAADSERLAQAWTDGSRNDVIRALSTEHPLAAALIVLRMADKLAPLAVRQIETRLREETR